MYRVLENSSATLLILCARALCDVWNIHPLYLGVRCDRYHKEARSTVHGKEITMTDLAVRPFRIDVPEEDLVDLRPRVAATRWPDRETVTDQSQGVQLAKIQELVRYWGRTTTRWSSQPPSMRAAPDSTARTCKMDSGSKD